MRLLLFAVAIIWLSADTSADDAKDTLDKVNAGVDAANAIVDVLGDEKFSKNFGKIGEVARKIGPFLKAVGPAIALVGVFMPSEELRFMKKKFAEVDAKFDQVFQKFAEVENLIQKTGLKAQYAQYEHTILSLSTKLSEILNAPTTDVDVYNRSFILEYTNHYDEPTFKIWNGMMPGTRRLSDNIPLTAMEYFDNDRKKVQKVMKGVLNLILQGVKVELAYLKIMRPDKDYTVIQGDWEKRVSQLVDQMKSYDKTVAGRYHDQIENEIPVKLAQWRGQSHSTFATNLFNFLNTKYDWRDWHVVAYNELHGGNHHWVKWCGGYHSFRHQGRNLVVASVDDGKSPINKNNAYKKLSQVSTRWCKSDWVVGHRCGNRSAKDVFFHHLQNEFKSCYNYASIGVIEKIAGIAHRAPPNRLAVRDNNKYTLHAFG